MNSIILAAGYGTRLKPWTDSNPKCLVPVGGIPVIGHTLNLFRTYGIKNVMINVHHCADQVIRKLGTGKDYGVTINYSIEETLLGTAGGIRRINSINPINETFILMFGDTLTNLNLSLLVDMHRGFDTRPHVTMSIFKPYESNVISNEYGQVILKEPPESFYRISEFIEKPEYAYHNGYANAGVMVIDPEFIEYILPKHVDLMSETIPYALKDNFPLYGWKIPPYTVHMDIGTPERLQKAEKLFEGSIPFGFMFNQTKQV